MDNENTMESKMEILESNLAINVTGCKEKDLQMNVAAVIEGIKRGLNGIPINLQINLYSDNGQLQFQNLINQNGEENAPIN